MCFLDKQADENHWSEIGCYDVIIDSQGSRLLAYRTEAGCSKYMTSSPYCTSRQKEMLNGIWEFR